jgi:hypothetical protein
MQLSGSPQRSFRIRFVCDDPQKSLLGPRLAAPRAKGIFSSKCRGLTPVCRESSDVYCAFDPTGQPGLALITSYKLSNINRRKLENLFHRLLERQLALTIQDRFGQTSFSPPGLDRTTINTTLPPA